MCFQMAAASYPTNQLCQWCSQPLIGFQQSRICDRHAICNKCIINKRSSQSACPCCWYENGLNFVSKNSICPGQLFNRYKQIIISILVCCSDVKPNTSSSICYHHHKHCSQCPSSGCILCKFLELRSWAHLTFENLPNDLQRIIATCDNWEKKFEEMQQINSNAFYDRQDSSFMDTDDNPMTIGSKFLL